jgi:hypothetical protein
MSSGALQPVANQIVGAANAVGNAAVGAANAVANAASGAANQATSMFNSLPSFNSLIPIGNGPKNNGNAPKNNGNAPKNNAASGASGFLGSIGLPSMNMFGNAYPPSTTGNVVKNNGAGNNGTGAGNNGTGNNRTNNGAGAAAANAAASTISSIPYIYPLGIFVGLVAVFMIILGVFRADIEKGYEYALSSFKTSIGVETQPSVMSETSTTMGAVPRELVITPVAPQTITPSQMEQQQGIVERILPSASGNEVFNVSDNKFTFYDAEPLCKALGAELATYEQVKDAWGKGADWCNYGWVKGQMAVYPTQKDTYDKLQAGPADQQNACGTTGLNGGYFDNPDMKYGVNCYGKKPSQSSHDQQQLMEQGKVPTSPDALKVNELVAEFRAQADSLFVKPFNDQKWESS